MARSSSSDRAFDRDARAASPIRHAKPLAPAGVPVDSSRCDSCGAERHCKGLHPWCECVCTQLNEDDELSVEFGKHPNDVLRVQIERENDALSKVLDEVHPVPRGWRA